MTKTGKVLIILLLLLLLFQWASVLYTLSWPVSIVSGACQPTTHVISLEVNGEARYYMYAMND